MSVSQSKHLLRDRLLFNDHVIFELEFDLSYLIFEDIEKL